MLRVIEKEFKNDNNESVKVVGNTFPATKGYRIKTKLIALVLPSMGGLSKKDKESEIDDLAFLAKIAEKIVDGTAEKLLKEIISGIDLFHNGIKYDLSNETEFDTIFSGDYMLLYDIILWCLKENFGSLFGENGLGKFKKGNLLTGMFKK